LQQEHPVGKQAKQQIQCKIKIEEWEQPQVSKHHNKVSKYHQEEQGIQQSGASKLNLIVATKKIETIKR
jgi:hypothetical protein